MRLGPWLAAGAALASIATSAVESPAADKRSGSQFMAPETQAIQNDDAANPGMLAVIDGEALWGRRDGAAGKSCADCHGDARASMRGVAARYPAIDPQLRRPLDLEQRVNRCRTQHQQAQLLPFDHGDLLALTAYVAHQSKGEPIAVTDDPERRPFIEAGQALFEHRQGQLNLSCAACHGDNWGKHLGGAPIPQAHPTGYPLYRLEWQGLGSLRRRLRNCLVGMRAESYPEDAPEIVNLELFLAWRAQGLPIETPAVRP